MTKLFEREGWVTNFQKDYPWYKKIFANIGYMFTGVVFHKRDNKLTRRDIGTARLKIRRGDILLMGNLHTLEGPLIPGPVTHSALYIGRRRIIEAVGTGVRKEKLSYVFSVWDTLVIVRLPRNINGRRGIIKRAIQYAKSHIGKPYDYDFKKGEEAFICTEIVNEAFKAAGYKTGLTSFKKPRKVIDKIKEKITKAADALLPMDVVRGKFDVVFLSHNLTLKEKKLSLKK